MTTTRNYVRRSCLSRATLAAARAVAIVVSIWAILSCPSDRGSCSGAYGATPIGPQTEEIAASSDGKHGLSIDKAESQSSHDGLLVPVDSPSQPAKLRSANKQWQLQFAGAQGVITLDAADVVQWGRPVEPSTGPLLVMADGSLIVAEPLVAENENLRFDSDLFGEQSVPLETLAGIVFKLPVDRLERDLLIDRLLGAPGQSDVAILVNGDELSGVLESLAEQQTVFRTELGPLKLDPSRLSAIILNPFLRRPVNRSPLRALVGFSDGSRLVASSLQVADQRAEVTVTAGPTLAAEPKHLAWLIPLGGRVQYLSDMEPAEFEHIPFLQLKWPYRKDRNVLGGMLRSAGQWHPKGVGVHSAARLVYLLDRPYRRFEAELAVDDSAGRQGSVVFRVLLDGKQKFVSPVIRGGDRPVAVSVPLEQGAKRLELVVDYADWADVLDRANWLGARLIK